MFEWLKRKRYIPVRMKIPKGKTGKITWRVTTEVGSHHLEFKTRREADAYKKLLAESLNHIPAKVIRQEVDEGGYHVTYPKEDK